MITIEKIKSILDESEYFSNTKKAILIFKETLPEQQRAIFDVIGINKDNATTCKQIAEETGFKTKNISAQIKQIQERCGWIGIKKVSHGNAYYFTEDLGKDDIEGALMEMFENHKVEYNGKDCGECNCVEVEEHKRGGMVKMCPCLKPIESDNTKKSNF